MKWSEIILEANLTMSDALRIFNISNIPDATTLKKLYQHLAIKNHPDRGGDVEKMKQINSAYEILKSNKPSTSSSGRSSYDNMTDQERKDKWKRAAYIAKSVIETTLDIHKFSSYFEEVFSQKFTVKSALHNPETDRFNQDVYNKYEFTSSDNEIVLTLLINVSTHDLYDKILLPGDEGLINMRISTEIVLNRRKIKLTNKSYSLKTERRTLTDPDVLFPRNKIETKKTSSRQQKVTRKDFEITFTKTLGGYKDGDHIFIPFNDNQNSVYVYRGVFMRNGYWNIHDIATHKVNEKFGFTSRKYMKLINQSLTVYESAEALDFMTDMLKHIQNKIKSPEEAARYIIAKVTEYKAKYES